mgnify:CR=1 FL=1
MSDLVGTIPQVAARLEVSPNHVRWLIRSGQLPAVRLGRRLVVHWTTLDRWLAASSEARDAS